MMIERILNRFDLLTVSIVQILIHFTKINMHSDAHTDIRNTI